MHPALKLPELLNLIFLHLKGQIPYTDLLTCCLACKIFSGPALDILWGDDLPSVTLLPFDLGFQGTPSPHYLSRLKFYGKRIRVLRVHRNFTPGQWKLVEQLAADFSFSPSLFMPAILPAATSLIFVLSKNVSNQRMWSFFLPTLQELGLYGGSETDYLQLTDLLRAVNAAHLPLTSLTIDPGIISDPSTMPPEVLKLELSSLILSLPQLKKLSLPSYLLEPRILFTIAGLPSLENLSFADPSYTHWRRSTYTHENLTSSGTKLPPASFSSLRSLKVDSLYRAIPQFLYHDLTLTSGISHLSLTFYPPPNLTNLSLIFPNSLALPSLQHLTHLSLNFTTSSIELWGSLSAEFFGPLFSAHFFSQLVCLEIQHKHPLALSDREYDDMARLLPEIEKLHLIVVPPDTRIREMPRPSGSLTALVSFAHHCQKLKEITIVVDSESHPVPDFQNLDFVPKIRHPVFVDMSISPLGYPIQEAVAEMFVKLFPAPGSAVTSLWASRLSQLGPKFDDDGVLIEENDDRKVYVRRWKELNNLFCERLEAL